MPLTDSLDRHLRSMESEELLRKAGLLRELKAHPGWVVLEEMVGVQRDKALNQLIHAPSEKAVVPAHAGGYVRGLDDVGRQGGIIDKVLETSVAVQRALESDTGADAP